jgi:hypothetical protein
MAAGEAMEQDNGWPFTRNVVVDFHSIYNCSGHCFLLLGQIVIEVGSVIKLAAIVALAVYSCHDSVDALPFEEEA